MDGVTTNGILLMHVDGEQLDGNAKATKWKEVSVGGCVFDLGEGRMKFNYQSAVNRSPEFLLLLLSRSTVDFSRLRTRTMSFAMELWSICAAQRCSGEQSKDSKGHRWVARGWVGKKRQRISFFVRRVVFPRFRIGNLKFEKTVVSRWFEHVDHQEWTARISLRVQSVRLRSLRSCSRQSSLGNSK